MKAYIYAMPDDYERSLYAVILEYLDEINGR